MKVRKHIKLSSERFNYPSFDNQLVRIRTVDQYVRKVKNPSTDDIKILMRDGWILFMNKNDIKKRHGIHGYNTVASS